MPKETAGNGDERPHNDSGIFIFTAAFIVLLLCFLVFWFRKSTHESPALLVTRIGRRSNRTRSESETQRMNQVDARSIVTLPLYTIDDKEVAPPAYEIVTEESRLNDERV